MSQELPPSLLQALLLATSTCDPSKGEEEGGFILKRVDEDEFEFHWVTNQNTGTPVAVGLYTAVRQEYADKILSKTIAKDAKWVEYASFHTHPRGFGPFPSTEDLRSIFTGFPINYIYSPDFNLLFCYTFNKDENTWQAQQVKLTNPKSNV